MHFPVRVLVLLLAGFLAVGGTPLAVAQTPDTTEETSAQKAVREANEAAAAARAAAEAAAQAQIDATNAEIQRLKNEIAALQQNLNLTTAQKQTLQTTIKALDLQIQKLQKNVSLTTTQISQKDKEIVVIAVDIRTTEEKIADARRGVGESLRQLEQMDEEHLVTALFGGGTLSSFFDEAVTLGSLRGELQNKITNLKSLHSTLQTTKQSAENKRKELSALKNNLNDQKQGISATRSTQNTLLTQTKNQEAEYQALLTQKKAEQSTFEAELSRLVSGQGTADITAAPSPRNGILQWPLRNVVITQQFGKTVDSVKLYLSGTHDGIDFSTKSADYPLGIGTPVRAALSGTVQEINLGVAQLCQYGKWIIIKHDNGLSTLYAHLSKISVNKGDRVDTGQTIGASGDTGYAYGPHLHFTVYASSAVKFTSYRCRSGAVAYIPYAAANAYLNPLSYLPAQ